MSQKTKSTKKKIESKKKSVKDENNTGGRWDRMCFLVQQKLFKLKKEPKVHFPLATAVVTESSLERADPLRGTWALPQKN